MALTKVKELAGYSLESKDGELGKVKDIYFDDRHWAVRYLIADTGTWLTDRRVLLSPYALIGVDGAKKRVTVDLTKKQIEDSPSLGTDKPVSRQFEENYYGFFGWPAYWSGSYSWGNEPFIVRDAHKRHAVNPGGKAWNAHLRSAHEVQGYRIHALDGDIGHVKDFIVEDEGWTIAYLVVDTQNWLPGRTVLISPKWIEKVSWDTSTVELNLSREAIKASPEYSGDALPGGEYEAALHGHYNREGNWVKSPGGKRHILMR